MAVIANQNQNDQQNQQQKGQNSLNPLQTVGTASSGGSTPAGTPQAQQQSNALASQQQSGSGRFTNLQKYLQANQGGSQRIAQNIENSYDKQANAVKQGINQAQGQLAGQVNPLQQQLGDQGAQQLQQGFSDPNAILGDQAQTQNFKNLYGGLSQNIANVAGTQNLQQQQLAQQNQNLQNTAAQAGTEQGRFQLLRNSVNAPGYTQGAQRLDQTLLQSQPTITNNLQTGLQGIAGNVNSNLSNLNQDTVSKINALKGLSQQRVDQWGNLLQNGTDNTVSANGATNTLGLGDIGALSQQDLSNAQNYTNVINPQLQAALKNKTLTTDQLTQIQGGAAPSLQDKLYGVDASQFFKPNTDVAANATNTIDKASYDRYNALRQLAGQDQQGGSLFGGPATDVGSFQANNFDKAGYQTAIDAAKNKYEGQNVEDLVKAMYPGAWQGANMNSTVNPFANLQSQLPGGTGMQSSNAGDFERQKLAATIGALGQPDASGKNNLTYENLVNAINGVYGGVYGPNALGQIAAHSGGAFKQIADYQDELAKMRGDTLGGQAPNKGIIPLGAGGTKVMS